MTGAFLRVQREGKWLSIEVEFLTDEERLMLKDDPRLLQWLDIVCHKLATVDELLQVLKDEGILEYQ